MIEMIVGSKCLQEMAWYRGSIKVITSIYNLKPSRRMTFDAIALALNQCLVYSSPMGKHLEIIDSRYRSYRNPIVK
jgi:hypothetical protein